MPDISVFDANAIKLAIQYFGDATNFVQIMDVNNLNDWLINAPIITTTSANANAGDSLLVLQPTNGIQLGSLVYCSGLNTYSLVTNVQQVYTTPAGIPFCNCSSSFRQLPASGDWVSTNVSIAPYLDNLMGIGSQVTFAVGAPTKITIPPKPPTSTRGVPLQ